MTTYDLQQHKTDLAILPIQADDSALTFSAKGTFANDDGISADVTDKLNIYEIDFEASTVKNTTTLKFTRQQDYQASAGVVNRNDYLGQIDILGAKHIPFMFNAPALNVTVHFRNDSI